MSTSATDVEHDIHVECDRIVEHLVVGDNDKAVFLHQDCQHWFGHARVDAHLLHKLARRAAEARAQHHHSVVCRLRHAASEKLPLASKTLVRDIFRAHGAVGHTKPPGRDKTPVYSIGLSHDACLEGMSRGKA